MGRKVTIAAFILTLLLVMSTIPAAAITDDPVYNYLPEEYTAIDTVTRDTVIAVDFTGYQLQKESWGKSWQDYKGADTKVFEFLKSQGVNTVSVKICVDPAEGSDEEYYSVDNAAKTLKAAAEAGLKTNAILTFSDVLTYKGSQTIPAGWIDGNGAPLTNDELETKATDYAVEVLGRLDAAGAMPVLVTIGNEINYDFLGFKDNDAWRGWSALAAVTNGIRAAYSEDDRPIKIGVNFAAPDSADGIEWYVSSGDDVNSLNGAWCNTRGEKLAAAYDFISVSYYPKDQENDYAADYKYVSDML